MGAGMKEPGESGWTLVSSLAPENGCWGAGGVSIRMQGSACERGNKDEFSQVPRSRWQVHIWHEAVRLAMLQDHPSADTNLTWKLRDAKTRLGGWMDANQTLF